MGLQSEQKGGGEVKCVDRASRDMCGNHSRHAVN